MLSNTLPVMLLGRVIQGIGTGIAMPLLFSIIMLEVPRAKQGSFVGTAGMIVALAPSLGPTYGGICLAALNWRFNFIFTLAVNNLSSGFASPLVWGGLLVTVISFVIFFKLAKQEGKAHIINISVLKNTSFNLGLLIYTFLQFIQISLTFVIPNLAQLGLKTSALTSGMLLLLGSLLSAFFGPVMGRLLDSQGFKKLFLIGSFLAMAGILLYIIFAQKLSIALIVIFHVMFMTGFSMMYNNSMTIGLQQLDHQPLFGLWGRRRQGLRLLQDFRGDQLKIKCSPRAACSSVAGNPDPRRPVHRRSKPGQQPPGWPACGQLNWLWECSRPARSAWSRPA